MTSYLFAAGTRRSQACWTLEDGFGCYQKKIEQIEKKRKAQKKPHMNYICTHLSVSHPVIAQIALPILKTHIQTHFRLKKMKKIEK